MAKNKALITAFSLTEDSQKALNKLQTKSGQTRSEIIRNLLNSSRKIVKSPLNQEIAANISVDDTNKILKYYYQLISAQTPKPTIVIGISLISQKGRVLVGLRKNIDPFVKNLSWTFPTGKFSSLDFEKEIIKTVKTETSLTVKVLSLVHARLIPDSPAKKVRIVALYYYCKILSGKSKSGGDLKLLKWVPATDVTKYFTTSVADEIMNFLGTL